LSSLVDLICNNYGAYKVQDVWKLTIFQLMQLIAEINRRKNMELSKLLNGMRLCQFGNAEEFGSFIKSLQIEKIPKRTKKQE
jgi:hypothetical protein